MNEHISSSKKKKENDAMRKLGARKEHVVLEMSHEEANMFSLQHARKR